MRESPRRRAHLRRYERGSSQDTAPCRAAARRCRRSGSASSKVEIDVAGSWAKSLKEAHRARLMVSFDESREAELDREIEHQSQNATQLSRAMTLKGGDLGRRMTTQRKVGERAAGVAVRIQALNTEFRRAQDRLRLSWGGASGRPVRRSDGMVEWGSTATAIDATTIAYAVDARSPAGRRRQRRRGFDFSRVVLNSRRGLQRAADERRHRHRAFGRGARPGNPEDRRVHPGAVGHQGVGLVIDQG